MSEFLKELSYFKNGKVRCSCGNEIPFTGANPLDFIKCSACSKSNFIPLKISRFWLIMPLGGGGMGSVYKAITEDGKTECAIKILPRNAKNDQHLIKNLLREIDAATKIGHHKNLVGLIDAGYCDGEYFMATEFINGERLDRCVDSQYQFSEREALNIMIQILEAEKQIVSAGFLFRDLKPENLIIEKSGNAKVFDYGLCITVEEARAGNQSGDEIEGSPFYLPPERIVGVPEGEYSEIYSMGMLFFFMLTGRTYYSQAEVDDLVKKHLTAIRIISTAPHLRQCNQPTIALIDKMIQRNPNSRFPDFASLETALKEVEKDLNRDIDKQNVNIRISEHDQKKTIGDLAALNTKTKFYVALTCICLVLFLIAGIYSCNLLETHKIKKKLRIETAKELGVNSDIAEPDISENEIKKIINNRYEDIYREKIAILPKFDEQKTIQNLCESMNINMTFRRKAEKSIKQIEDEINQQISLLIDKELKQKIIPFDENKKGREIAESIGIKYPPLSPDIPLDEAKKQFKVFIDETVDKKFSLKSQAEAINKAHETYGGYRIGQNVRVILLPSGKTIEGKYIADKGDKLVIGNIEVQKKDLSQTEIIKFNQEISDKRVAETIKKIREEFKKNKKKYFEKIKNESEDKFFKTKGYLRNKKGEWANHEEILKENMTLAKSEHDKKNKELESIIKKDVMKKVNIDKVFKDNGYIKINKQWIPEDEALKNALESAKKIFNDSRINEINKVKKEAMNSAEKEIFPKHNYIFYENRWQPAKNLLDQITLNKYSRLYHSRPQ